MSAAARKSVFALLDRHGRPLSERAAVAPLIAAAAEGSALKVPYVGGVRPFFRNSVTVEAAYPSLRLPEGTRFEIVPDFWGADERHRLVLLAYQIGGRVGLTLALVNRDPIRIREGRGWSFVFPDGSRPDFYAGKFRNWVIVGVVVAATFPGGKRTWIDNDGLAFDPETGRVVMDHDAGPDDEAEAGEAP